MVDRQRVEWHFVAAVDEIVPSSPKQLEIDKLDLAIHNIDGDFFAINDICTHSFARLSFGSINGAIITCPLHLAEYDIRTGKVLEGPADEDLETYPTKVMGGKLYVGIPA